jgi:hypothetical protein
VLLDPPPPPPPPDGGANGLENSVESSSSSSMCTVVVVVSCKDPPPAFDPPHAPPPPSPVCWNGFPLLLIFLHDKNIKRERENIEIQTSLQRSFFNASEFFKIALHESPLPVLLETVSVKSVVLCERFCAARVSLCLLRVIKIKASAFLSSPKL